MNRRLKRVDLVVKLAKRREDQSAAVLLQWQKQVAAQQQQLEELRQYEQHYLVQARAPLKDVLELQAQRQFLGQLIDILAEQEHRLSTLVQQCDHYRGKWLEFHQRRKLLEEYRERVLAGVLQEQDKYWDRLCEEMAQNAQTAAR